MPQRKHKKGDENHEQAFAKNEKRSTDTKKALKIQKKSDFLLHNM